MARATSSPSADRPVGEDASHPFRPGVPRSFQTRLTLAFIGVVAVTLALVAPVVINRLDDYFREREVEALRARRDAVLAYAVSIARLAVGDGEVIIEGLAVEPFLNPRVAAALSSEDAQATIAQFAQADAVIAFGRLVPGVDNVSHTVEPIAGATFTVTVEEPDDPAQRRDPTISAPPRPAAFESGGVLVQLRDPYTTRASTLNAITGLLVLVAAVAFGVAVILAALISRRFATPLKRLTETSRLLAEGDLSQRVPAEDVIWSTSEVAELARQFDAMADRLEESIAIIRRDRDRSRDFLADVSHELRTPIAALRTFNELLQGGAAEDPAARREFLESSAVQLERLDWLAQNLLELSKLESGLVLLDLRPEDVRATVESAVEQAEPTARRRGLELRLELPTGPLRIRHDPPRVGQIVTNLVGNALKFTPRGGSVRVSLRPGRDGSARIEVTDTGVGIDASELPRIFDRFYRGSASNEARSTGSGLGLAIVKSIVDMHRGTVEVESRVGAGSTFVVVLPRDPREAEATPGELNADLAADLARRSPAGHDGPSPGDGPVPARVADSSSSAAPRLNSDAAP